MEDETRSQDGSAPHRDAESCHARFSVTRLLVGVILGALIAQRTAGAEPPKSLNEAEKGETQPTGLSKAEVRLAHCSLVLSYFLATAMVATLVTRTITWLRDAGEFMTGRSVVLFIILPIALLSAWCASLVANVAHSPNLSSLNADQVKLWRDAIRFPLGVSLIWGSWIVMSLAAGIFNIQGTDGVASSVITLLSLGSLLQGANGLQSALSLRASVMEKHRYRTWVRNHCALSLMISFYIIISAFIGVVASLQGNSSKTDEWQCQIEPITPSPSPNPLTMGPKAICSPKSSE